MPCPDPRARSWLGLARRSLPLTLITVTLLPAGCRPSDATDAAAPVRVAVAASASAAMERIAGAFTLETGHTVALATGSTGQLYAQALAGAPHELFVAADPLRPRMLDEAALAVPGTLRTLAIGRLVLYAPRLAPLPDDPLDLLDRPDVLFAWANPRTAPYGAASLAVLASHGHADREGAVGESVGQALQFVRSGAADAGFVALSQVIDEPPSTWALLDASLHPPLALDAVLLAPGRESPAARALLDFLSGPRARQILAAAGYEAPPS